MEFFKSAHIFTSVFNQFLINNVFISQVQCVDYGYKVIVPSDSLLTLPDEMTRLPIQALCCSLCDIQTTDWSSKAIDFFNGIV